MLRRWLAVGLTAGVLLASPAAAHKPSDSYLTLTVTDREVAGQWDITLRDLEHAIGLDRDGDGAITWGELRAKHDDVAAYALARLELASAGSRCPTTPVEHLVDEHSDGTYAVLRFTARCAGPIDALEVTYGLLFDLDPLHRGLIQLRAGDLVQTTVLGPDQRAWRVVVGEARSWETLATYLREGVWHIWIGLDHVLFLVLLLLPAVLRRRDGGWQPVDRFDQALLGTVKVVTAFTVAHSVTLTLAVLDVVQLPSRLIESAIAASVVLAALNNLWPLITRRLWLVAFGFGLVHGMGFAGVLMDLGLPQGALVLALLGFNLGVELGQLAIVAAVFPIAYGYRASSVYAPVVVRFGSLLVAVVAGVWLLERALGAA